MIKKIMIATDGSDTSKKAAMIGIDIAHRANGSIIAVYVMEILRLAHLPGYATMPGLKEKILELMHEEGQQATQFVEDQARMMNVSCPKDRGPGQPQ
jgi:nucleotide-binding universal stress UspA family protein